MTELRPLDAGFIELEDSDRHISLGIGAVAILSGTPPSRAEFTRELGRRIADNARLRQRVHRARLDLSTPNWEEDANFDLAHHIRWIALPEPADDAALFDFIATDLAERLDRDHPLWECVVIERLTDERWAMLIKAHHSLVDGVSGVTMFATFCDPVQEEAAPADASVPAAPADIVDAHSPNWFDRTLSAVRLPFGLPGQAVDLLRSVLPVAAGAIIPAAESSLNGSIGRQRRYIGARTSLTDVREIRAAFGTTVNDVVLAAVTSGYRALLLARGERPVDDTLRILVPVSMRPADAMNLLDNRVSALLPRLPVHLDDPVVRLRVIHTRMAEHKSKGAAQAEDSMIAMAARLPFATVAWSLRLAALLPQRGVTALATNVRGPRVRVTVQGREVLDLFPIVPIAMRLRTGIAILSYLDHLNFGITGDFDSTPDIEVLAEGIRSGIAELLAAARARAATAPHPRSAASHHSAPTR
ncbi:wax ester/triacylglycerol synthase family O-acyltransferase [Nocardia sp. NBC_01503]|uniref:wax ester/triacylglycerol synthase family O-acyltransferase n=1 Tax=Nocardia sp. NBC_01503 TaxID=2975997 RepID=UPI002E7BC1CF|nr:wax ester/triacylglycerol synthase family O-acyltransferase [Nocardia sp. NBC_01503]WTL31053.1 wax ester/triacylglycerol synthase family O-acyltransferase [Nocardia sp. NBC_01503]